MCNIPSCHMLHSTVCIVSPRRHDSAVRFLSTETCCRISYGDSQQRPPRRRAPRGPATELPRETGRSSVPTVPCMRAWLKSFLTGHSCPPRQRACLQDSNKSCSLVDLSIRQLRRSCKFLGVSVAFPVHDFTQEFRLYIAGISVASSSSSHLEACNCHFGTRLSSLIVCTCEA